jgi:hypothetical protein
VSARTCCWFCKKRVNFKSQKLERRRLQLLPPKPKGCPVRNYPCTARQGGPKCIGDLCQECAGFKPLPTGLR